MEDSVFAILWYKIYSSNTKSISTFRPFNITYGYNEFSPRVKIYSPLMHKTNVKWISNLNANDVGGFRVLPSKGKLLVITKSYKDYRVLKNLGIITCWFQSENTIPHDLLLLSLTSRFEQIVVLFDNDGPGIIGAEKLVEKLNSLKENIARSVIIPNDLTNPNMKDPSDYYKIKGKIKTIHFLLYNKLI